MSVKPVSRKMKNLLHNYSTAIIHNQTNLELPRIRFPPGDDFQPTIPMICEDLDPSNQYFLEDPRKLSQNVSVLNDSHDR